MVTFVDFVPSYQINPSTRNRQQKFLGPTTRPRTSAGMHALIGEKKKNLTVRAPDFPPWEFPFATPCESCAGVPYSPTASSLCDSAIVDCSPLCSLLDGWILEKSGVEERTGAKEREWGLGVTRQVALVSARAILNK